MNNIITLISREFFSKIKSKFFIIGTFLGPLFMFIISVAPVYFMKTSQSDISIAFVDNTGVLETGIKNSFSHDEKSSKYDISFILPDDYKSNEEKYRKKIEDKQYLAIVNIPEDVFTTSEYEYLSGSLSNIEFITGISTKIGDIVSRERLQRFGLDPDKVSELTKKLNVNTLKIGKDGKKSSQKVGKDFITAYFFVIILYMTTVLYSNSILTGVLEEKTSKVLEVLLSSCTSFQLMMGKLFGVGSVGLFQFTIWTILGGGSFMYIKSSFPEFKGLINLEISIFLYFILFFVTGFFQYATLFLAAGSLCSNQEDARQLATPVTFLIVAVFILSFNAMNNPGSDSVRIMSFIPFFTPMMMFVRITVASPELWEIILSLVINIIAIFFFIYLTSKIYRVGILMYGKRPSFKEVITWLKYS